MAIESSDLAILLIIPIIVSVTTSVLTVLLSKMVEYYFDNRKHSRYNKPYILVGIRPLVVNNKITILLSNFGNLEAIAIYFAFYSSYDITPEELHIRKNENKVYNYVGYWPKIKVDEEIEFVCNVPSDFDLKKFTESFKTSARFSDITGTRFKDNTHEVKKLLRSLRKGK